MCDFLIGFCIGLLGFPGTAISIGAMAKQWAKFKVWLGG